MGWEELSTRSHYQTAIAIKDQLEDGKIEEAKIGIEELIDAMGRSDQRALKSQLIRLMAHVIKWKSQPERRSLSWVATIYNARDEIIDIQEETPGLTDEVINLMWEKCFKAAIREAEAEMNKKSSVKQLTWVDVFKNEYRLDD